MMSIPCDECLVYPICRNKVHLNCDKLYLHFENTQLDDLFERFPKLHSMGMGDGMSFSIMNRSKRKILREINLR